MAFSDLFKPRWKHSDPAVREAAVAALDQDEPLFILIETDPEPKVRAAALAQIIRNDKPHGHAKAAIHRLAEPREVFPFLAALLGEEEFQRFKYACAQELDAAQRATLITSFQKSGNPARARELARYFVQGKPGLGVDQAIAAFPKSQRIPVLREMLAAFIRDDLGSNADTDRRRQAAAETALRARTLELGEAMGLEAFQSLVSGLGQRVGSFGARYLAETLNDRELWIRYLETLHFLPTSDYALLDRLGDAETLGRLAEEACSEELRREARNRLERLEGEERARHLASLDEAAAIASLMTAKSFREEEILLGRIISPAALASLFESCGRPRIAKLLAARLADQALFLRVAGDRARPIAVREAAIASIKDRMALAGLSLGLIHEGALGLYELLVEALHGEEELGACYRALREGGFEGTEAGERTARRLSSCPFCGKMLTMGDREEVESEIIPGDALAEIRGWTEYTYRTFRSFSCACGFTREWLTETRTEDC